MPSSACNNNTHAARRSRRVHAATPPAPRSLPTRRSSDLRRHARHRLRRPSRRLDARPGPARRDDAHRHLHHAGVGAVRDRLPAGAERLLVARPRSEEHASELQSPCNLGCRLLPAITTLTPLGALVAYTPPRRPLHALSLHAALPIFGGTLGIVFGGGLADWMLARGQRDAMMRIGIYTTLAWAPFGIGYLLVPSAFWSLVLDRKSTRLNSSHLVISDAVFCLQ